MTIYTKALAKCLFLVFTLALGSLFVHTSSAFTPSISNSLHQFSSTSLFQAASLEEGPQPKGKLSRPERKALERQKKQRQQQPIKKQNPKYNLHSTAVSKLTTDSTADDVLRAIKRAQNLHDHHDLRVIADFLIDECGVGFAYGYRGSLLSRLAVAALHFGNHQVARRAIDIRRTEYRPSMLPMESAAIIRGLLRVHNVTDAFEVFHDELSLPLEVRRSFYAVVGIAMEFCPSSYSSFFFPLRRELHWTVSKARIDYNAGRGR
jgi:hypothetical protein